MIYVLHGQNTKSAYNRLKELESKFPKGHKVKLDKEHTYDDLFQALFSTSLLDEEKEFIVFRNFIKDKKVDFQKGVFAKDIPGKTVVFYEESALTPLTLKKLPKHFVIEMFKQESKIFDFLDSLSPSSPNNIKSLYKLSSQEESSLIWNLTNRFLGLTLAKMGLGLSEAAKITGRPMAPWQWQQIQRQAYGFELKTLKNIFNGLLKIDFMIKSGQTHLPPKTLISYLLLKYLKR